MAFVPRVELDEDGFPIFVEPLPLSVIKQLDPFEDAALISDYMTLYGGDTPNQIRLRVQKQIADIPFDSNSEQWEAQLERIGGAVASKNGALAAARRTAERMSTSHESGGNTGAEAVYVTEDEPCPACDALGGIQQTIAEFEANAQRPGDQCYQGDLCRCDLVVVNAR